jgi:hypothetical protein
MDKKEKSFKLQSLKVVSKNKERSGTKKNLHQLLRGEIDEDEFDDMVDDKRPIIRREFSTKD